MPNRAIRSDSRPLRGCESDSAVKRWQSDGQLLTVRRSTRSCRRPCAANLPLSYGAAKPFVETDPAEARFAQRHERALLDPAAVVSGLGVTHDLTRVTDRLQIAGNDLVERRSFRAGDLDDAVSRRRERHIGNGGSNVVRRDGLEQAGRKPDDVSTRT